MGIINSIKHVVKRSLGVEHLKQQTAEVKALVTQIIPRKDSTITETFEQALTRLNLTEADIIQRSQEFNRLYKVFSILFFALCLYLVYVLFKKAWIASLGTSGVMLIVLAQLFRYHFWLFQIKERRLGCSFKEWMRSFGKKKEGVFHE